MLARAPAAPRRPTRRGATIVEAALVLPIFLMFVFGIFEYGRYIFVLHITTNAAREGARHAVVRSSAPEAAVYSTVTVPSPPAPSPFLPHENYGGRPVYTVPFVETYTRSRMGGVDNMISQCRVRVFPCDTEQLYNTPCVVAPKATSTSWANAAFSERIAVRVVGEYKPILPNFLGMSDTIPVSAVALMGSEG